LAVEFKHGLPAITAPFEHMTGLSHVAQVLGGMSDTDFLGWLFWLSILLASTISLFLSILGLLTSAISWYAFRHRRLNLVRSWNDPDIGSHQPWPGWSTAEDAHRHNPIIVEYEANTQDRSKCILDRPFVILLPQVCAAGTSRLLKKYRVSP
jgi:hypothetical protein